MTDSTTEAKYITAFEATKEVVWICKFIGELGVVSSIVDPITVIVTTMEPRSHPRIKFVLWHHHLIMEIINLGDMYRENIDR